MNIVPDYKQVIFIDIFSITMTLSMLKNVIDDKLLVMRVHMKKFMTHQKSQIFSKAMLKCDVDYT